MTVAIKTNFNLHSIFNGIEDQQCGHT